VHLAHKVEVEVGGQRVERHPGALDQIPGRTQVLVQGTHQKSGVGVGRPESGEALGDVVGGGEVVEQLRVDRPCAHAAPLFSQCSLIGSNSD